MAITYKILKKEKLFYRSGYDITVKFTDDTTLIEKNVTFYFESEKEPLEKDMLDRLVHIANNVQDSINEENEQRLYPEVTRPEIEDILREKGFLTSRQKLEDLKTKAEIIAEATADV
jgi:hypothetical protein